MNWEHILAMLYDPWAAAKEWRKRRAALVKGRKPTYDVYPDEKAEPEIKLYVEARDAKGRLLREYVYLEGYGIRQLNWKRGAMRGNEMVRDWFVSQVLVCVARLAARLEEVKRQKETADAAK